MSILRFRFEWKYGVAAVIAVFHDTIITIGLFSLLNKQIDLTVIAALLTLVGYSMNDTIVTFDRIRENLRLHVRGIVLEYRQPQHQSDFKPDRADIGLTFSHRTILVLVWWTSTEWLFFSASDWYYYRDLLVDFYREPDFGFLAQRGCR